jgi:hypothetical protein
MKEITLKAPKEVLKVNIGDKSFSIPLGSSLPFEKMMKLTKSKGDERLQMMFDFLAENIPENILSILTMGEISQILKAWSEETEKVSGATPGES